jgi:hypothetical protein
VAFANGEIEWGHTRVSRHSGTAACARRREKVAYVPARFDDINLK